MVNLLLAYLPLFIIATCVHCSSITLIFTCRKLKILFRALLSNRTIEQRIREDSNFSRARKRGATIILNTYTTAVLVSVITCVGCSLSVSPVSSIGPKPIKLAESVSPFYSLHVSADLTDWIVIFGDYSDLTLKLARGPLITTKPSVTSITTIDRVDVPPGVNPNFGLHVYLQHNGVEHLFYSDQILADSHTIKWIYRSGDSKARWMVEPLLNRDLPLAAFQTEENEPGFTLFQVNNLLDELPGTQTIHASSIHPLHTEELPAFRIDAKRLVVAHTGTPISYWQSIRPYSCVGRRGFALPHDSGVLLFDYEQNATELSVDLSKPWAIGCENDNLVIVYAREDPQTMLTSSGATLNAQEIVALTVDSSYHVGAEIKVTLAREVGVLAAFLNPEVTVLFSELALDADGASQYHLSVVTPTDDGEYGKHILWRGTEQLKDIRALLGFGRIIVVYRKANQLHILQTKISGGLTSGWQESGSY